LAPNVTDKYSAVYAQNAKHQLLPMVNYSCSYADLQILLYCRSHSEFNSSAKMLRKCKMVCLPTECCSHKVSKKSINYKRHTSKYSIVEKLAGQAWTRTGKKLAVAFGGSTPLATQNCRVV